MQETNNATVTLSTAETEYVCCSEHSHLVQVAVWLGRLYSVTSRTKELQLPIGQKHIDYNMYAHQDHVII